MQTAAPHPEEIPVRLPDGRVGTIAPADLKETIAQGGQVISPDTFVQARHEATQEAKYGGLTGPAIAYGEGQLRGISLGLSDPAIIEGARAFGGDEAAEATRQHLAGYAEQNKAADFLGQAGGAIAGAIAVPASPAGMAARAEAAIEGGAARVLGEGVAAKAAGRTLAGAAAGGAMGAGSAVSEAALGDTPITAEKVLAGAGTGAFLGGATSGLFSLAGSGAGAVRDEAGRYLAQMRPAQVESLAEKEFGYAPKGLGEKFRNWYAKAASAVSGADAEGIEALTRDAFKPGSAGERARRVAVYEGDQTLEQAARDLRGHGDNLLHIDRLTDEGRGVLKADKIARSVKRGNESDVARVFADQVQSLISGAEAQLAKGPAPQAVKSIESVSKAAYRAEAELSAALKSGGDNGKAFIALDEVKRDLQRMASDMQPGWKRIADPIEMRAYRDTADWMASAAEGLRVNLEDESIWGKAAIQQQNVNAAWTKQLDAKKRFQAALVTDVGRDPTNPYLRQQGMDPGKLDSYVKNLTNPNKDLTHQAVNDYVMATADLARAMKESYDLPAAALKEVDKVQAASAAFKSTLKQAGEDLAMVNIFKRMTQGQSGSMSGMLGTLGLAVGGLPGGVIGAAADAFLNPAKKVQQLAAAERLYQKTEARIGSSIRGFLGSGTPKALPPASEVATEKGFAKAVKEVTGWQAEPQKLATQMGRSLGDLPHAAPNLSSAMTVQASRIAKFLYDKMPVGMKDPYSINPSENDLLVSDAEREEYAVYHRAALEPDTVFRSLEHGMVTPEEAEALQTCWPEMFQEAGAKIDAEVRARGKEMPYDKAVQLGVLFDRPTVPELAPQVMAATAKSYAYVSPEDHPSGPSGSGRPLNLPNALATSFSAAARNDEGE